MSNSTRLSVLPKPFINAEHRYRPSSDQHQSVSAGTFPTQSDPPSLQRGGPRRQRGPRCRPFHRPGSRPGWLFHWKETFYKNMVQKKQRKEDSEVLFARKITSKSLIMNNSTNRLHWNLESRRKYVYIQYVNDDNQGKEGYIAISLLNTARVFAMNQSLFSCPLVDCVSVLCVSHPI